MGLEMLPVAEKDAFFRTGKIAEGEPAVGADDRYLHDESVVAQFPLERRGFRKTFRVPGPLDPQTLQEQVGPPGVRRKVLGDDARQVFSVLRGGAQLGCAVAHELIGDGAPNRQHDHGDRRYQLDAELTDGRQGHGRNTLLRMNRPFPAAA